MAPARYLKLGLLLLALVAAGAAAWFTLGRQPEERLPPLGLFTSLPIYWSEAADISAMLSSDAEPHWARRLIERRRDLQPLDVLTPQALAPFTDILIAQPRALGAAENVALDGWVRGGGHVLLFADPLLTQHSQFGLGDRRRPMGVALLSPILTHWGLALTMDDAEPEGERQVQLLGGALPVDQAGRFILMPTQPDAPAACHLLAKGLAAECRIGAGHALIVADAALLDHAGHGDAGGGTAQPIREAALSRLLEAAFTHH